MGLKIVKGLVMNILMIMTAVSVEVIKEFKSKQTKKVVLIDSTIKKRNYISNKSFELKKTNF